MEPLSKSTFRRESNQTEGQNRVRVDTTRDILPAPARNIGVEVKPEPASVRRTMAELRNIRIPPQQRAERRVTSTFRSRRSPSCGRAHQLQVHMPSITHAQEVLSDIRRDINAIMRMHIDVLTIALTTSGGLWPLK